MRLDALHHISVSPNMVEVLSFSALPTRPPTPPRSSSFNLAAPKSDIQQLPGNQAPLSTPVDRSSPLDLPPHPQSSSQSKRVNFSPLTSYIKPPSFTNSNNPKTRTPLRALLPSNQYKPSKSILKTSCSSPASSPPDEQLTNPSENLPAMLESITNQLAGESHASRADAYQHLLGALTTYENIPDEDALAEKVEFFSQCIRRDICEVSGTYQPLDVKLVRQALNLFAMFIYKPRLSSRVSEDLKVTIIDHIISSLQNPNVPKVVVIEYMRVLSIQSFSPKVMTANRVTLLLTVLRDITDRVEGKAVVAQRLAIYERLLFLPQSAMAAHAELWIDQLVTALLHNFKEVRTRAIRFGKLAAVVLGPNFTVSIVLKDVLDYTLSDSTHLITEVCGRLTEMISDPEAGPHVPQIWSVIILLLRSRRWSIGSWSQLKEWLLVIQKCFNYSDPATKSQALMAWDLFVYALPPSETTGKDITKILFRPILSQLERKKTDKQGILLNQAFASYHKLLYYAFRPSASHSRLDLLWTTYIKTPFSGHLNSEPTNNKRLCQILSSLLWNQQPKIWEEDKVKINKATTLKPEDLPRLDCKWVRSRLSIVLPVFESLFKSSVWNDNELQESGIGLAWINLSKALADASNKEITPSPESMQALASILGTLQRIWKAAPSSLNADGIEQNDTFYSRFHFLVKTIISFVGPNPFTDKLLLKTSQETFQTANTPTHHRRKLNTNVRSPMLHLLHMITTSPPPLPTTGQTYFQLIHSIIAMSVQGRTSRNAKLKIFRQFSDLCLEPWGNASDTDKQTLPTRQYLWQSVAKLAKECLTAFPVETELKNRDDSAPNDYEKVIAILTAGSGFDLASLEWFQLLDSFSSVVQAERGENALPSILETLSGAIRSQPLPSATSCCSALLDLAKFSSNQEQSPSPLHPPIAKSTTFQYRHPQFHSWNNLIDAAGRLLKELYQHLTEIDSGHAVRFLDSMTQFLGRCPSSFGPILLSKTQDSLVLWITDRDGLLITRPDVDDVVIASARSLIRSITALLQKSADSDDKLLQTLATLISSGLESRHKSTVNSFIKLWNDSFGSKEKLEYPENVETVLRRLKPFVQLLLPNFPPVVGHTVDPLSPEFLSSREEVTRSETPIKLLERPNKFFKVLSVSPAPTATPAGVNRARRRKRSSSKITTPKPRLRHDDSQIQFVPVESSPANDVAGESQVLTEHQQEVRDRQRGEAAKLYPVFRSPASQPGQVAALAKLGDLETAENSPPTPMLDIAMTANDEEFLGSSPTPTSKNSVAQPDQMIGSSLAYSFDTTDLHSEGPPSSPPQIQSEDNLPVEASEVKRISELKDEDITLNGDVSSPPGSSPTPTSGGTGCRRGVLGSRKKSEQKTIESISTTSSETLEETPKSEYLTNVQSDMLGIAPPERSSGLEKRPVHTRRSSRIPNVECDRIDIIPDSFSDDLERQIASQLEQDLELTMDMEVGGGQGIQGPDASIVTRSMKRKRGNEVSSQRDRAKRVSPSNRSLSAADDIIPSKSINTHLENTPVEHRASQSDRPNRSRRKMTSMLASTEAIHPPPDTGRTSISSSQRKTKKRRSLRLSCRSSLPELSMEQTNQQTTPQLSPDLEMEQSPTAAVKMDDQPERPVAAEASSGSTEQQDQPSKLGSPGASILASLRSVLGSIRTATFGRSVLREIDDVMFDIKAEAHDAARRHERNL
ncbi:hypothetical protein GX48_02322 [Paracoccidioides brasiliensis]|nr:hypothetical protein GX48_02322 [Paracoccidioides brasiliensis]